MSNPTVKKLHDLMYVFASVHLLGEHERLLQLRDAMKDLLPPEPSDLPLPSSESTVQIGWVPNVDLSPPRQVYRYLGKLYSDKELRHELALNCPIYNYRGEAIAVMALWEWNTLVNRLRSVEALRVEKA